MSVLPLTELRLRGIRALPQASFSITYKGRSVGEYVSHMKCVDKFSQEHTAQCLNYLKASV